MTGYELKHKLDWLIAISEQIPDNIDIINAEVQFGVRSSGDNEPIAKIHLHDANMEKLATYFHEDLHAEYYGGGYDILYFYKYGVKIFMLKERAAALSGTEETAAKTKLDI